ncbi:MAG: tetratricopeptide repeat protein [Ktedonobacterales bacterium]
MSSDRHDRRMSSADARERDATLEDVLRRAGELRERDDDRPALLWYQRAVELGPGSFDAWCGLAHVCWKLARHEESLVASERALALDPRSMLAWTFKAEALLRQRRYAEAVEACDQALAIRRGDAKILYCRDFARAMLRAGLGTRR